MIDKKSVHVNYLLTMFLVFFPHFQMGIYYFTWYFRPMRRKDIINWECQLQCMELFNVSYRKYPNLVSTKK